MAKPIFKQYDMGKQMKKAEGNAFTFYPTYKFQKKNEYYKDRIGLHKPIYVGRK